tara:strand:+ start:123 stop:317 length:195 start_codon:yes stop_codon:yes gene_type:complete
VLYTGRTTCALRAELNSSTPPHDSDEISPLEEETEEDEEVQEDEDSDDDDNKGLERLCFAMASI